MKIVATSGRHRDHHFSCAVGLDEIPKLGDHGEYRTWTIDGIEAITIELNSTWWVVAAHGWNDDRFEDVGPFNTAEQAVVYANLMDGT